MLIDFSAAQIGAIINALDNTYDNDDDIDELRNNLCDIVFDYLGEELFSLWEHEFILKI